MRKFYNLNEVATDIIVTMGQAPESRLYEQIIRLIVLGMIDLKYNITPTKETRTAIVEDNNTIPYFDNSYKVLSVGKILDSGAVAILGKSVESPIATAKISVCNCSACGGEATASAATSVCANSYFYNYIEGNTYIGELYAFTEDGYSYGRYFDNVYEGRIEFTSVIVPGDQVVVQYQLSEDKNSQKLVAVDDYHLLETWVLWKHFRVANRGLANDFRNQHRMEISKYKKRLSNYTYTDVVDALTSSYNNAVR